MAKADTVSVDHTDTAHHAFSADVARLLQIVAKSLYSNRDVFLRELISNAADACDRLRYEAVTNSSVEAGDLCIRIYKDTDRRTLTILDTGIGMTRDELIENLGTIAKSGTAALMEQLKESKGDLKLIGQFGVGFYASFVVADHVEVISRKAGSEDVWVWISDGKSGFETRPATEEEKKKLPSSQGTCITLNLDDEASDFLLEEKIKQVVQHYSDHVSFPIFVGEKTPDETPVNTVGALWSRPPREVSDEDYNGFYQHVSHGFDTPLMTSHWHAEGLINYAALLYVPTMRAYDLFDPSRKHTVRLYVRRVLISEECEGLIYPWLRFLRGVVDCEDLPLNISREMLQHNPVLSKIRSGLTRHVLSDLNKLSENDSDAFNSFWGQFGMVVKEGLYDAYEHREEIFKITRFRSSMQEGWVSLQDYIDRMKDGQEQIYYLSGENVETLKNSPHLEGFAARGIEVLFMTDSIDDFWIQTAQDYKEKPFVSITKGAVDLDKFTLENQKEDADKPEGDSGNENKDALEKLRATFLDILKDEVGNVRLSSRMVSSPVCLVAADDGVDMKMERLLKIHQKYDPAAKRILEINPGHAVIKRLAGAQESAQIEDAVHLLYDQARIIQGEPVKDPAQFSKRMSALLEAGFGL